jgi:hypothetical protein
MSRLKLKPEYLEKYKALIALHKENHVLHVRIIEAIKAFHDDLEKEENFSEIVRETVLGFNSSFFIREIKDDGEFERNVLRSHLTCGAPINIEGMFHSIFKDSHDFRDIIKDALDPEDRLSRVLDNMLKDPEVAKKYKDFLRQEFRRANEAMAKG